MLNGESGVLNQFRQGSAAAFETLFRLHQRAVYGWILRITRNPATAEELTIETFWRIHCVHAQFDPAKGFDGWARRIETRVALDWLRARRMESELSAETCGETSNY
jgi:RNA polymerase sigma-70 factor (ECF subfamily)